MKASSTRQRSLWTAIIALVIGVLGATTVRAGNPDAILGDWIVGSKKAKVTIYKENNKYYGKIVWLREPNGDDGKPKVDKKNPDPAQQSRPLMGLTILWGFGFDDDDNEWVDGRIYAADDGKEYKCKMWMEGNELKVRGYVGFSLLGRTDTWVRP